ncbi:BCAT2 [Symbiodinium sp. CCMP2592]|nr:BCAT2 [Symbiodinium sp. CCMP2592]
MAGGAERFLMPPVPPDLFMQMCRDAVRANADWVPPTGKGSLYMRPLLFGSGPALGVGPSPEFTFVIYVAPVGSYFSGSGARLRIERGHHRAAELGVGDVKAAGNYAPCFSPQKDAKAAGQIGGNITQPAVWTDIDRQLLKPQLAVGLGCPNTSISLVGEIVEVPTETLSTLDRYGRGDRVVKLSLSGTKFLTLRSTLAHSAVLDSIVTRAETNEDLANDGAIFVDRDPKHFPIILNHLRMKAEGREIFQNPCKWVQGKSHAPMLPRDTADLRDLLVEAEHYGLPELRKRILSKRKLARLFSVMAGSSGNPFDSATRVLMTIRNTTLLLGTGLASSQVLLSQLKESKDPMQALDAVTNFTATRFSDILYFDPSGERVEEAAASNFFCITEDGVLKTPELGTILSGVTRDSILQLARNMAASGELSGVQEGTVTWDDILSAKEGLCRFAVRLGCVMAETVRMNGFVKADVQLTPGERPLFDYSCFTGGFASCFKYFCLPPCSSRCRMTVKNMRKQQANLPVDVADARKKEVEEGLSKHDFFEKYGFVLLKHQSKMTAEDWLAGSTKPSPETSPGKPSSSKVRDSYAKEIEPLIRELLPKASEISFPSFALRRGPGGPNPFYGFGVHQDYGLYPEDMKTTYKIAYADLEGSFEDFLERCYHEDTAGFSIINFWRPVPPMAGPVKSTPLAVCDPSTVKVEDCVPIEMYGFVPGGQRSLLLRQNADQKWYYYPDMTTDEVLVFRQFHYERGMQAPYHRIKTVFHTAFKHPGSSPQDEARSSSEYRLGVWLK